MTTLPNEGGFSFARNLPSLRLAIAAGGALWRALRNRRAALHVADLSDEMLSDIGLRRDDVHVALNASWREDPTYQMAILAHRRRR